MKRKGKAAPSLQPLSAANRWRKCAGTCLSAYLPPTTAAARMGSVGVRHAATTREERKLSPGISAYISAPDTNQPYRPARVSSTGRVRLSDGHTHVMTGPRRKNRLFQCRCMYAFGSSTPMAKTPMASTTRVTSRVIVFVVALSLPPQPLGSKMLAPYGPEDVSAYPTIAKRCC